MPLSQLPLTLLDISLAVLGIALIIFGILSKPGTKAARQAEDLPQTGLGMKDPKQTPWRHKRAVLIYGGVFLLVIAAKKIIFAMFPAI